MRTFGDIFYDDVSYLSHSITVPLTSYLTGLDWSVLQIKTKIVSCHTADSKPVKQEVNGTVKLPPLVFSDSTLEMKMTHLMVLMVDDHI